MRERTATPLGHKLSTRGLSMIPNWLVNVANGRNVTIALVLWFGYAGLFFNFGPYSSLRARADSPLLEERFGYSQAEAQEQLRILGEEGRGTYRRFQLLDGVNAVLMAIALTLSLAFPSAACLRREIRCVSWFFCRSLRAPRSSWRTRFCSSLRQTFPRKPGASPVPSHESSWSSASLLCPSRW